MLAPFSGGSGGNRAPDLRDVVFGGNLDRPPDTRYISKR
jgi:hypothetical protein